MERFRRAAHEFGLPVQGSRARLSRYISIAALLLGGLLMPSESLAATLSQASVGLSDPRPSQTAVTYTVTVSSVSAVALRCITTTFVTTPSGSTAVPSLSASSATIAGGSTILNASTGSWSTSNTANSVTYTNTTNSTAPSTTSAATFVVQNVTNGNTPDTSYWLQLNTYSNSACTTPIDSAIIGFIYTNGSTVSLTVDQSLSFTIAGVATSTGCDGTTTTATSTATTLPFGTVTASTNGVTCQDLSAATNATNGYTIYARYSGQPDNGIGHLLADHTGSNTTPTTFSGVGTEAYGYTTDDSTLGTGSASRFTSGGQKWAAMTTSNAEVAYEAAGVTNTTYRIGHQVGISTVTAAGSYLTTIIYTCTPVY